MVHALKINFTATFVMA